jgi:hydrogenase expression/formation protein HypD
MKYIDEYRDTTIARGLLEGIERRAAKIAAPVTIMEVCGSHTQALGRYGIRAMLPENVRLVSGPGCPVCVTAIHDVDIALWLAGQPDTVFVTFGDMLRVPGTRGRNLQQLRAAGADIRVVASATDCIAIAAENQQKEIIFMGIGFETTSPTVAAVIVSCRKKHIKNVSVFSVHKLIPPALKALMHDPALSIDGFLCPGHVSIMIGVQAYACIPEAGRAAVITGFEPVDILEGIFMLLGQVLDGKKEVALQYGRGVKPEGNVKAMAMLDAVFCPSQALWRGLGEIPESGLRLTRDYADFDALQKFKVPDISSEEISGCRCGDILRGILSPHQCPLFRKACTPLTPVGACMVSSEGTCAAYYKYH